MYAPKNFAVTNAIFLFKKFIKNFQKIPNFAFFRHLKKIF